MLSSCISRKGCFAARNSTFGHVTPASTYLGVRRMTTPSLRITLGTCWDDESTVSSRALTVPKYDQHPKFNPQLPATQNCGQPPSFNNRDWQAPWISTKFTKTSTCNSATRQTQTETSKQTNKQPSEQTNKRTAKQPQNQTKRSSFPSTLH